jgi:hypothetical protein
MTPVLFVTNGHGEVAIAERIAAELRALGAWRTDHFPLVGAGFARPDFPDVGPQAKMPSGGLVAMGNVGAFALDLRAGFAALWFRQRAFLRAAAGRYRLVIAVGDVYALLLARLARTPLVFVGTAKSAYVAPYGPFERRLMRAARAIFVRDGQTAHVLQAHGVPAQAPGNVIVDLVESAQTFEWRAPLRLALLPGSRERAYADGERLAAVARAVGRLRPGVDAALSIAPGLDPARFEPVLAPVSPELGAGIRPWTGEVGALVRGATLAIGQAGTANEAAAASGVPVVALDLADAPKSDWYRMRQGRLLGEALAIVPGSVDGAAAAIAALLDDAPRRARMGAVGIERMGPPGGAQAIAGAIAALAA